MSGLGAAVLVLLGVALCLACRRRHNTKLRRHPTLTTENGPSRTRTANDLSDLHGSLPFFAGLAGPCAGPPPVFAGLSQDLSGMEVASSVASSWWPGAPPSEACSFSQHGAAPAPASHYSQATSTPCLSGVSGMSGSRCGPPCLALSSAPAAAPPVKKWAAFLSHYKTEAAMEARFLQTELEVLLGRKCFLDSDDLRDLRLLQQSVRQSDCLILVQSKSVLSRPYCLLELFTAIEARVPIVGVSLQLTGGAPSYDFNAAPAFLARLEQTLESANPGAASVFGRSNIDLRHASRLLSAGIPRIVSIAFCPSASRNKLAASISDIAAAIEAAVPNYRPLRSEGAAIAPHQRPARLADAVGGGAGGGH